MGSAKLLLDELVRSDDHLNKKENSSRLLYKRLTNKVRA